MKEHILKNRDERVSEEVFKSLKRISDLHKVDISILEIVYLKGKEDGIEIGHSEKTNSAYEYGFINGSKYGNPIINTTTY